MNVRSRCYRILNGLAAFDRTTRHMALPTEEEHLGTYINSDKSIAFALTIRAIYLPIESSTHCRRIPLKEIVDAFLPDQVEKRLARTLRLALEDGSHIDLRIDGRNDRYSDVFEVQRFFMRVRDDFRKFPDEAANTEKLPAMALKDRIRLDLTADEALVLFAWLARFNENKNAARLEDAAEQRVLWDLEAQLEGVLVEPLDSSYDEILAAARNRVRDAE